MKSRILDTSAHPRDGQSNAKLQQQLQFIPSRLKVLAHNYKRRTSPTIRKAHNELRQHPLLPVLAPLEIK